MSNSEYEYRTYESKYIGYLMKIIVLITIILFSIYKDCRSCTKMIHQENMTMSIGDQSNVKKY